MAEHPESPPSEPAQEAAAEELRAISRMLSDFRLEVLDGIRRDTEAELAELEKTGYDPARGRGRGPHWMKDG